MITIQTTTIEQVLPIRHKAMYPDGPITLAQTEDDLHATHYGLFIDQQCLSVITAVDHDDTIQLRKFATLPSLQNQGYGSMLLSHVLSLYNGRIILNARTSKISYYKRFGFRQTNQTFTRNDIDYCIMEVLR
ncbi:GNAT family N-acetyltransferase [Erysipelothrix rhusiopathiae]|uniref:Acetyltransferase, GNAT family n=1 Tax=Erysipelothrix rhusiopathiae ATCC 19414 TaxID=525280 RepID=E7FXP6_ERYRH|nr:GNAT family N-acetyltransferase [Erysipelothrix rhusiopathiae]EFY08270.1 acetyltransferase, GNAT family [Erysipelothrix rhusiopathiae ATCC 19414]MCG4435816.1 GNAT family N-acetyltransferase [Erysipelothrix rhusiopathiae]MCG4456703.1 GNAT family N-acetyltransferase [Erysipelothrix rhusiopathiae]MDE8052749.1 GNAT family N-acetyltransferase [Erysipelothrix rhusiopathiae]MDE8064314.1 GNAT family N-acetyltransferase [Erysipelothrix rhusiopathiae]